MKQFDIVSYASRRGCKYEQLPKGWEIKTKPEWSDKFKGYEKESERANKIADVYLQWLSERWNDDSITYHVVNYIDYRTGYHVSVMRYSNNKHTFEVIDRRKSINELLKGEKR